MDRSELVEQTRGDLLHHTGRITMDRDIMGWAGSICGTFDDITNLIELDKGFVAQSVASL
jgi:hypothetical protein